MAQKKITTRWLTGSLGVIVAILIVVEIAFALSLKVFYYNSVRQMLVSQGNTVNTLLTKYSEDPAADYKREVRNLIENFNQRDKMELMALDDAGTVITTSSGFEVADKMNMPDFEMALTDPDGFGEYQGKINGENIFAVTMLAPNGEESLEAIRLVVSLGNVDQNIILLIVIALIFGFVIIFFMVLSGSYFISSIVIPVSEIGKSARKIAQGDFATRLTSKNDDEIGELCETINYMAEELANNEKLKNDFISSVSHELRTPLTAIKGWSETIASEDGCDAETLQKAMRIITGEADRLSLMVEELLDFSRMQSGGLRLNIEKIDLLAELEEAVIIYTEKAKRDRIDINYIESELNSAAVMADKNRLRQVFINIIDNAIKYSNTDGGTVTIETSRLDEYFVVAVTDTGCGISPEDLPRIKQKFYKANYTRRGSGIGLAVADEIIHLMAGSLEITSILNVGTTVTIMVPTVQKYQSLTSPVNKEEK